MRKTIFHGLLFGVTILLAGGLGLRVNLSAAEGKNESIARGGQLYDAWWNVVPGAKEPKDNHPLWQSQTTNKRMGSVTWRCKECHGWDYRGHEGAYGSGSHKTGFPGVWTAAQKKNANDLVAILKGSTNPKHTFSSVLRLEDMADITSFLKSGLLDMMKYVDYKSKKPIGGNVAVGRQQFVVCGACHGADGKKLNFGSEKTPEYVGTLAKDNPQEFIHKIWVGQPGSNPAMPAGLVLGWNIKQVLDVLAYSQTLPEK